jgi:diguanylate cyclase (GGDEF)-like protein/putative nucleotidyltransferase with HDIG domain
MASRTSFTRLGKLYLWSVILAGLFVIGWSLRQLYFEPIGYQWFVLAALTLISGSATVKLPSSYASISVSETFVFTAVLLYGPAAGTVIVALDALVISFWISKRNDDPHRALFNMSAPAVSAWCSSHLFFRVAHVAPLVQAPVPLNAILPALAVFALTYFGLNSWLITFVIALERKLDPVKVWSSTFVWLSLNYFGGASVAILFVGYNRTIDLGYVSVIVPLLLVLWFTFRTTMGRVEDADRHVEQLNKLYLSTIETLAMAIDAKDQVTHGHIRRVQLYATSLARYVGIREEKLLKAIEAAALLHDMGKLAVPEYILNKPGKLTEAEFEKMKLHASVGAEILSAIDFPYPVVPIVRHHHENWDGSGYPDGLRGTDIPIGARILSVVDCYDALTSDRPYRPRLSDQEALQVLNDRRGTMYDPLVVDTFARVHDEIAPELSPSPLPSSALNEIASARKSLAPHSGSQSLDEIAASSDETLTLFELARALGSQVNVSDAADIITKHLRRLVPSSLCVFFIYDDKTAEIEASHAIGEGAAHVKGLRIQLGQRLSGWVAANRQTIVNSDPVLDLGDIARHNSHQRLRSCLSTPLTMGDDLVGVVSLYSHELSAFTEDHRRVIEAVGQQAAAALRRPPAADARAPVDVEGIPGLDQLERLLRSEQSKVLKLALLLIRVTNWEDVTSIHGSEAGDDILHEVVRRARAGLRGGDILIRGSRDEFVAVLPNGDPDVAATLARRVEQAITSEPAKMSCGSSIALEATVRVVSNQDVVMSVKSLLANTRSNETASRRKTSESSVH